MFNENAGGSILQPERLKQARLARGYTRTDLAGLLQVSRQAVHQYENGVCAPSIATLSAYQMCLGFPRNFFFKPLLTGQNNVVHFRKLESAKEKKQGKLNSRIYWMRDVVDYMSGYLDLPEPFFPKYNQRETYEDEELEEIADGVRKSWGLGLGPISNVCLLLENNGFIISKLGFGEKDMDACSTLSNDQGIARPFICLTTKGETAACRSRFDLAHELGHMVLHSWADDEYVAVKDHHKRMEKEANYFAGAFLLPLDSFLKEVHYVSSLKFYTTLKERWKVSIAAMIYRCKNLHILSDYQYQNLQTEISRLRMRQREPLDDVILHEEPTTLKQAVKLLIDEVGLRADTIADDLALPIEEVEEILAMSRDESPFRVQVKPKITLSVHK